MATSTKKKPKDGRKKFFDGKAPKRLAAPSRTVVETGQWRMQILCYYGQNFDFIEKDLREMMVPQEAKEIADSMRKAKSEGTFQVWKLDYDHPPSGNKKDKEIGIIWCRYAEWPVIYHESLHAACWVLDDRGALSTKNVANEETLAYCVDEIARQVAEGCDVSKWS